MIEAIETKYNGIRFRSKLEAKWAFFFDEAGIEYLYEPTLFPKPESYLKSYLPDFYLKQIDAYAEVKPLKLERFKGYDFVAYQIFDHEDYPVKWNWFSRQNKLIILAGEPSYKSFPIFYPDFNSRGFNHLEFNLFQSAGHSSWGQKSNWQIKTGCTIDECNFELGGYAKRANNKKFEHRL